MKRVALDHRLKFSKLVELKTDTFSGLNVITKDVGNDLKQLLFLLHLMSGFL